MKPLNILEVTPVFYPTLYAGGVPLVAFELCKRLAEKGHRVTVYTTDLSDGHLRLPAGERDFEGMKTYYFRNLSNSLASRQKIFLAPSVGRVATSQIGSFDIIHCHEYRTLHNIIIYRLAREKGIPYVLQPHGSAEPIHKRELKRLFDIFFGYKILHGAGRIIATAKHEAEQIVDMGVASDKVVVLPNALDISKYAHLPPRRTFRKKWGIGDNERIVLYVGRIHSGKGIDLLVKAFASLAKELSQARLVIVGSDDGFLPTVKKLVRETGIDQRTLFTGYVGDDEKLAAYVDSDVFFTHSSHGSMLLTYLEAWACKLPVVTIDVVDIILPRDQVDGVAGFVVPYDVESLKKALHSIMSDEELRRQFGENGRKIAEQWRDWGAWVDLVEEQYYQVLEARGTRAP